MDPVQKLWMYENWLADQNDNSELAKNHAYLLASFWNPEAVKEILGFDGNTHISTDEELEESSKMVKEMKFDLDALTFVPDNKPASSRKRRKIKE